jgi:hypothetical protein
MMGIDRAAVNSCATAAVIVTAADSVVYLVAACPQPCRSRWSCGAVVAEPSFCLRSRINYL